MNSDMAQDNNAPARSDAFSLDIERECETWDWVRAAGVSAEDLRKVLRDSQTFAKAA